MTARVAVTGLGVVAPLGNSIDELFASLRAGKSGIRTLPAPFNGVSGPSIGATVETPPCARIPETRLRMLDRVSYLALAAAAQAIEDSGIDFDRENRDRCGVSVGTGMGGATTTDEGYHTLYAERSDRIKPFTVIAAMTNAAAAWIGLEYALAGPNLTYSTACSSSAVSIGEAAEKIRTGRADVMIAGGAEAPLTPGVLRAWDAMRTLARPDKVNPSASCRPFSMTRSGLVLGEGAAFLVLESWDHAVQRGGKIHAVLRGYGLTTDVAHVTRPTVIGQARAMRAALNAAGLAPEEIDYINAHGTATLQNDAVETSAIKEVFGARAYQIPVSSTKSMHGHLLGAAGALELVICVGCLERGWIPPTMHLDQPDPACDLDYVAGAARENVPLRIAFSNSFAFGGTNAVLAVEKV
ncbi:MAG TPA: beta-ketoacyl-[acyl-carrier-protein] synthase family protein [Steroidobacteraceae bacterium]|jgi:3-oxoacyl-[acyl-carrier-protein] synthase II|nr:beta-ketoacyl-[acyl-carrier-protein] synthase family protein [Steroidobacteraceae bacterium]